MQRPEKQEMLDRIGKLLNEINRRDAQWDALFLVDRVNQYYLTGTMQDGVFVLKKDGSYAYFVRRSFERAKQECLVDNIYPMTSYKDVLNVVGDGIRRIYIEGEVVTYGMLERLKKYFDICEILPADRIISRVRSVKSRYELACMEESGRQHKHFLESIVPGLIREGMNEAELTALMFENMVRLGYHGVARFSMFQTEIIVGQIGFGENSLYPTSFDGPGGMKGQCPAAPLLGDRERLLKKGDLVFVDIGYGVNGYHTDRTQIYMFGQQPPRHIVDIHRKCIEIQAQIADMLRPGNIPSDIYNTVMNGLDAEFKQNFMGFGERRVKFLGHGVGLYVDETPVIANGFAEPLEENMALAVEPKKGVAGIGVLGVEDTYVVTKQGGRCITGGEKDIIVV